MREASALLKQLAMTDLNLSEPAGEERTSIPDPELEVLGLNFQILGLELDSKAGQNFFLLFAQILIHQACLAHTRVSDQNHVHHILLHQFNMGAADSQSVHITSPQLLLLQNDRLNLPLSQLIRSHNCSYGCGRACNVSRTDGRVMCGSCDSPVGKVPIQACLVELSPKLAKLFTDQSLQQSKIYAKGKFNQLIEQIKTKQEQFMASLDAVYAKLIDQNCQLLATSCLNKRALLQRQDPQLLSALVLANDRLKLIDVELTLIQLKDQLSSQTKKLEYPMQAISQLLQILMQGQKNSSKTTRMTIQTSNRELAFQPTRLQFDTQILSMASNQETLYLGGNAFLAKYDLSSRTLQRLTDQHTPTAMFFREDSLYFACYKDKSIYSLGKNSRTVLRMTGKSQFQDECYSIFVEKDESILLADYDNHSVTKIVRNNKQLCYGGMGEGIRPGQLSKPFAVLKLGQFVFVSDRGNNRILSIYNQRIHSVYSMCQGVMLTSPRALALLDDSSFLLCQGRGSRRFIRVQTKQGLFMSSSLLKEGGENVKHRNCLSLCVSRRVFWSEWQDRAVMMV